MAKKMSEMTVKTPKKKEISAGPKQTYVNKTQAIFSLKNAKWVEENLNDLITAVDQYLRTWNNPSRKITPGGLVERRNKRMVKILSHLQELEKKRE